MSTLLSMVSLSVFSADSNNFPLLDLSEKTTEEISPVQKINYDLFKNEIKLSVENDDWINTQVNSKPNKYSVSTDKNLTFGNEISFAWNFTDSLKINLNVFDNQLQDGSINSLDSPNKVFGESSNKSIPLDGGFSNEINSGVFGNEINRGVSGYKFGISSELGIGDNYKLGLNLDYGQLEGADLVGFNSDEIATTSFALGIRKSKFGASLNTDIYIEDDIDVFDTSRLGFEIDWHFSDETKISLGSKQRINNTISESNNSLNGLTGNVQYIKFQHNL